MRQASVVSLYFYLWMKVICACPNLLNQWQQMSLQERAERAFIVVAGSVVTRIPSMKTSDSTYSIKFAIKDVLKGADILPKSSIPKTISPDEGVIVKIEGFGPIIYCLSNVMEDRSYILFVKVKSDGYSLMAHYISSMGAAAEWTAESHQMVASTLGWRPWSSWSACSTSCNSGQQSRSRYCHYSPCYHGTTVNTRHCLIVNCQGSVDLKQKYYNTSISLLDDFPLPNSSTLSLIYRSDINSHYFMEEDKTKKRMFHGQLSFVQKNNNKSTILDFTFESKLLKISVFNQTFEINFTLFGDDHPHIVSVHFNNSHVSIWRDRCPIRLHLLDPDKWTLAGYPTRLSSQKIYVNRNLIKFASLLLLSSNADLPDFAHCEKTITGGDILTTTTLSTTPASGIAPLSVYEWSAWSRCSVTCGRGWRRRRLRCVKQSKDCLLELKEGHDNSLFKAEECNMGDCPSTCGIKCLNGGFCISNRCICLNGYQGPTCNEPICQRPCQNGGLCVKPNICICPEGYRQPDCMKPICKKRCENGGQCVAPDLCACPVGYKGKRCQQAICIPNCRNGGACIYPNLCSCNPGTSGRFCENYECFPQCMNGGKCVRQGKCSCKTGFSGQYCQNARCWQCFNGGRCTRSGVCSCPEGFYGTKCEYKNCVTQLRYRKVIKPVVKSIRQPQNPFCNSAWNLCRPIVSRSVVVHKIIFKPYFACT